MMDHLGSFGSFASYGNSSLGSESPRTALLRSERGGGADGYMVADGSPVGQGRADGLETLSRAGFGNNEPSL